MCGASGSHIWPAEPAVLEPFCAMDSHFKDPSSLDAVTFGQALHVTYAAGAFHFNSFKLEMRAAPGGNANKKKKMGAPHSPPHSATCPSSSAPLS